MHQPYFGIHCPFLPHRILASESGSASESASPAHVLAPPRAPHEPAAKPAVYSELPLQFRESLSQISVIRDGHLWWRRHGRAFPAPRFARHERGG
jgi:hypothetical protein